MKKLLPTTATVALMGSIASANETLTLPVNELQVVMPIVYSCEAVSPVTGATVTYTSNSPCPSEPYTREEVDQLIQGEAKARITVDQSIEESLEAAMEAGDKMFAEHRDDIDSNTARIETNETNIANNTSNISSNTSRITTNETNISSNTTAISTNKAAIDQNTAEISNLQDKVEEMEAGMAGLAALYGIPDMERGVGVGVGSYNGHVAVAVGYQDEIAEGVHVKVGVSIDEHGNNAVSGGIGWEF